MVKVIGKQNCSACDMTITILQNNNIDIEYLWLTDLDEDERKRLMSEAREKNMMSMPLILKDNKLITLQELI